jgi:hypothetical protein
LPNVRNGVGVGVGPGVFTVNGNGVERVPSETVNVVVPVFVPPVGVIVIVPVEVEPETVAVALVPLVFVIVNAVVFDGSEIAAVVAVDVGPGTASLVGRMVRGPGVAGGAVGIGTVVGAKSAHWALTVGVVEPPHTLEVIVAVMLRMAEEAVVE